MIAPFLWIQEAVMVLKMCGQPCRVRYTRGGTPAAILGSGPPCLRPHQEVTVGLERPSKGRALLLAPTTTRCPHLDSGMTTGGCIVLATVQSCEHGKEDFQLHRDQKLRRSYSLLIRSIHRAKYALVCFCHSHSIFLC